MAKSKDLFDDSTMSFGEHLEALRVHLWKAIIGVVIAMAITLTIGKHLVAVIQAPIENALAKNGVQGQEDTDYGPVEWIQEVYSSLSDRLAGETIDDPLDPTDDPEPVEDIDPDIAASRDNPKQIVAKLRGRAVQEKFGVEEVELVLEAAEFEQLRRAVTEIDKPKTFNVQEAFMTYLKVSLVAGLVLASPWVFWQLWLFVAAGLYPHERKYVYYFLPMSLFLFLGGGLFCFFIVFPYILDFLLGFNNSIGVQAQIRLSEWISFAILLPVMFGVSFQLPLVMLLLERLQIFDVATYREQRRMSILVIAILSMFLTPGEPVSMVMMMVPLIVLYQLGIVLCSRASRKDQPYAEAAT